MMDYQNSRKAVDAHNANSLLLNSEIDERYVLLEKAGTTTTSTNRKSKKTPTYHQTKNGSRATSPETYNPTPNLSYPPNALPKLAQPLGDIPAATASLSSSAKPANLASSLKKATNGKGVPSIEELLGGQNSSSGGSMVKSNSDFLWKGKQNNLLSHTAPLASPMPNSDKLMNGNKNSSKNTNSKNNNQDGEANRTYSSAAERKIAAIVELNLQEISAGKKPKTSSS